MELAAETGIGGVFFWLAGIPGFILMVVGGGMLLVDRRVDTDGPDSSSTPGRKLFFVGLTMFVVTGVFAGVSAWLLSS